MAKIVGRIFLNQFRVDEFIASGGMGAVYRVWDLKRNVSLAMKVLHAELADDPSIFKRFQREARALKKLAHPNIVPFYGLFQADQFSFLLEHYVDGPTLKEVIKQHKRRTLLVPEAMIYIKALCAALGYAHSNGVVHCDVKPGNVMIDRGGSIYLTDFGIVRHTESTSTTLATAGTAAYIAPEQIKGTVVSPATDIYALGIILFEMLTGQRPFQSKELVTKSAGETTNERIRYAHLQLPPPNPCALNPNLPIAVGSVIQKALAKDPSARYLTTQEFLNAVASALQMQIGEIPDRVQFPQEFEAFQLTVSSSPTSSSASKITIGKTYTVPFIPLTLSGWQLAVFGGAIPVIIISLALFLISGSRHNGTTSIGISQYPPNGMGTNVAVIASQTLTLTPTRSSTPTLRSSLTATNNTLPAPSSSTALQPAHSAPNLITYAVGPVGNSDIFYATADGFNSKALANKPCDEAEPAFRPGTTQIIYQSNCNVSFDLWIVDVNGTSSSIQLTSDPYMDEREPDWSPDGSQIVFRSNPYTGDSAETRNTDGEIMVVNSQGGASHPLGFSGRSPVWSPDGHFIAFMSDRSGRWQVYVYEISSGSIRLLTNNNENCRWPSWSPDGLYIAYNVTVAGTTTPDGIWYVPVSGGTPIKVLGGQNAGRPTWSENGLIAFNTNSGIEVIQRDGTNNRILIKMPSAWAPAWNW
jgi:serine/threonine protein kinase